jgi:hypothetical protein
VEQGCQIYVKVIALEVRNVVLTLGIVKVNLSMIAVIVMKVV